jgi:hypothetical protein
MSRFIDALSERDAAAARRLLRVTGDLTHPATLLDPLLWSRTVHSMVYKER